MNPPIRILIVDDHPLIREGLHAVLGQEPDLELVGQAAGGLQAIELAHSLRPEVILMDLLMPDLDGAQATQAILRENPQQRIILLTSLVDIEQIVPLAQAGAAGYVLKNAPSSELLRAIRQVAAGGVALPDAIVQALQTDHHDPGEALTDREVEIVKLIAQGLSNQEIATQLTLTRSTVGVHVSNILDKLHADNRTQVALWALRRGLMHL